MKKIKKILVPTDFSAVASNAFRYAMWLAKKWEADIHLLHIIPESDAHNQDSSTSGMKPQKGSNSIAQQKMNSIKDSVALMKSPTGKHDYVPSITSEIRTGTPSNQIEKEVEKRAIDLIVMGVGNANKETDYKREMVRINTLEKTSCSILLIPEKLIDPKIQTIAYAAALNEADPYYIWRTGKLFTPFNPTLHIVHIEKDEKEDQIMTMPELKEFFGEHPSGLSATFHTISSNSRINELKEFEKEWKIDLMVMSRPHRGFFAGLFHTSVSKQMVFNTIIPLLIYKH